MGWNGVLLERLCFNLALTINGLGKFGNVYLQFCFLFSSMEIRALMFFPLQVLDRVVYSRRAFSSTIWRGFLL